MLFYRGVGGWNRGVVVGIGVEVGGWNRGVVVGIGVEVGGLESGGRGVGVEGL